MGRVDGKVALISGGARGMGAEHARLLVEDKAGVTFAFPEVLALIPHEVELIDVGKRAGQKLLTQDEINA